MSTLAFTRLRLAGDAANFDAPLDVLRRATPQFWRGNDVQFEIAVFFNGALQDVSNLASLTLEVRPLGSGGAAPDPGFTPLMGATVTSFDNTTTLDDWNSGVKQHAVVAFTAAQSNIVAGSAWLSVFVITNDSPGRVITLCAGPVRVLEDGAGLATTPSPAGDTFYTAAQSDARFAPISGGGGGGGGTWGSITGTLSSQTDLASALGAKLSAANNLSDLASALTARTNLGLGSLATLSAVDLTSVVSGVLPVANGGTGASSLTTNAVLVGAGGSLGSVSTGGYGVLCTDASGVPGFATVLPSNTMATTPGGSDNSTLLATTAWVRGYTAPISNDGSGHYIFGGGSAYTIFSGYIAELTINGGFVATSSNGECRMVNTYVASSGVNPGYIGNVLSIQATDPNLTSGIRFIDSNNMEVGAVGYANTSDNHPAAGMLFISASEPYPIDGTTISPIAPPPFGLFQEGSWNSDSTLHQVNRIRFETNWDIGFYTPFAPAGGGSTERMLYIPMTPTSSGTQINYGQAELQVRGTPRYADTSSTTSTHSAAQLTAINGAGYTAVLASLADNSSYHAYPANGMWVGGNGPGGVAIMATNASGIIAFYTGGDQSTNERISLDASGNLLFSNAVTSAPSVTLASGQYQITVYDNGSAPVLRVRYNDGGTIKTGDLTLS